MKAIVTCEACLHRRAVERPIRVPETLFIVCHRCECSLRVTVTDDDIAKARQGAKQRKSLAPFGIGG